MYYTFQQSLIWDGYNRVDKSGRRFRVKGTTEQKARRKLERQQKVGLGRNWILVATDDKPIIEVACPACGAKAEKHMLQDGTVYCSDFVCGFMGQLPEDAEVPRVG